MNQIIDNNNNDNNNNNNTNNNSNNNNSFRCGLRGKTFLIFFALTSKLQRKILTNVKMG